jgi:MFS family permease
MLLGTGLTGILAPALGGQILVELGWRWTFIGLALCWGLVAFPLCFFFLYGAKDVQRTLGAALPSVSDRLVELPGMDGREAFLSFKYFRLALSIALVMLVVSGTLVHLISFFIDSGMDPLLAATLASVIGLANMIGRVTTGLLLDRFSGSVVGSIAFLMPAVLMVLLLNFDGSIAMAIACAALLGLSAGAELDVAAYLTSRHFGMKSYGFLFGTIAGIMSLAMGVGPLLLSTAFDHAGEYDLAFKIAIPMAVLAAILVGSLGRYDPRFAPAAR